VAVRLVSFGTLLYVWYVLVRYCTFWYVSVRRDATLEGNPSAIIIVYIDDTILNIFRGQYLFGSLLTESNSVFTLKRILGLTTTSANQPFLLPMSRAAIYFTALTAHFDSNPSAGYF
jgi:hypothetical protein